MNNIVSGRAKYNPSREAHEDAATSLISQAEMIASKLVMRPRLDPISFDQFIKAHRMAAEAFAHSQYVDLETQQKANQLLFDLEGYMKELVAEEDYGIR